MILPSKHVPADRCLLSVGAELLAIAVKPMTASTIWELFQRSPGRSNVGYDWFVLALDLLFMLGAIEIDRGLIRVARR